VWSESSVVGRLYGSTGYSSSSLSSRSAVARQGLRRILDIETARATADYLDTVAEELHHEQGVSGPAAERMIQATRNARSRFEGKFLTRPVIIEFGALSETP
jgi:hypothetical protein